MTNPQIPPAVVEAMARAIRDVVWNGSPVSRDSFLAQAQAALSAALASGEISHVSKPLVSAIIQTEKDLAAGDKVVGGGDWSGGKLHAAAIRVLLEAARPVRLTREVIDAGAQRLASFEDGSVWPDSWDQLDVVQMQIQAERVIRSALVALSIPFIDGTSLPSSPQTDPSHDR